MASAAGRSLVRAAAAALAIAAALPAAAATPAPAALAPCLACHGAEGQSMLALVPSLGGQPAKYLLIQLFMFREGMRRAAPMNAMLKGWSDDKLQQATDFLSGLPAPQPPSGPADPQHLERARAIVEENHCNICHRTDFSGDDNVPRLAGQREDYLRKALGDYKSGRRHGWDPTMAEALQGVDDAEIADLAYYLSRFPAAPAH